MEEKITKEWRRLMSVVEKIGFGHLEIVIQDGKPVRVRVPLQDLKLDGQEDEVIKSIKT